VFFQAFTLAILTGVVVPGISATFTAALGLEDGLMKKPKMSLYTVVGLAEMSTHGKRHKKVSLAMANMFCATLIMPNGIATSASTFLTQIIFKPWPKILHR
jgi:hypothetical protein